MSSETGGLDETLRATVLFADDDEAMRNVVEDVLATAGYDVRLATNGEEALALARGGGLQVIVTDLRMPGGGLELVKRLHAAAPSIPIILITAFGDAGTEARARAAGAADYFSKPVRMAELTAAVARLSAPGGPA